MMGKHGYRIEGILKALVKKYLFGNVLDGKHDSIIWSETVSRHETQFLRFLKANCCKICRFISIKLKTMFWNGWCNLVACHHNEKIARFTMNRC